MQSEISIPKFTGKVIVAEDQLHNMTVIKQLLRDLGKEKDCEFVYNGQEAVCKFSELVLSNNPVSHIITDFMMPRLNGIQTILKIKEFVHDMNEKRELKIELPKFYFMTNYRTT